MSASQVGMASVQVISDPSWRDWPRRARGLRSLAPSFGSGISLATLRFRMLSLVGTPYGDPPGGMPRLAAG